MNERIRHDNKNMLVFQSTKVLPLAYKDGTADGQMHVCHFPLQS